MDASFIPVEVVPSRTPFGLDQLRRIYKTPLSAQDAIVAAPAPGTADETFINMFLMPVSTPESAESATRIDLLYIGSLSLIPGIPLLPAQKHDSDVGIQSATTSYGSAGSPGVSITIQYYAPTNTLSYFSFGAAGTTDASDPTADPVVVAVVIGGINFTPSSIPDLLTTYFTPNIVAAQTSNEIVPGQYWQNVARKTKGYLPYVVNIVPGTAIVSLSAPGANYRIGDILSISAGGESATMQVTALGGSQSVLGFATTSNTFTVPQSSLASTGGSGTGARFNVAIL